MTINTQRYRTIYILGKNAQNSNPNFYISKIKEKRVGDK